MNRLAKELARLTTGRVVEQEPLSTHTTFRLGGPADVMVWPTSEEDLGRILAFLGPRSDYLILGRGSNLLVSDAGFRGVAVVTASLPKVFHVQGEGRVEMAASLTIGEAVRRGYRQGLTGLEFLAGVPGTVGGAVAMNAGARGEEIGGRVLAVRGFDRLGGTLVLSRRELGFAYRSSRILLDGLVVTNVTLEMHPGDVYRARERWEQALELRRRSQPLRQPNAGSIFRNPPGLSAGWLIEAVGGKGRRVGGAEISSRHANFIVNLGDASAGDVLALMLWARESVWDRFGVLLEPEIRLVGFAAEEIRSLLGES